MRPSVAGGWYIGSNYMGNIQSHANLVKMIGMLAFASIFDRLYMEK